MVGSPIRFTGLFSGMDTQSMVQQLMRAESMRMDRFTRRRQLLQWRQDDLRSKMTDLDAFRTANTSLNNRIGGITDFDVWNTMTASVLAPDDPNVTRAGISVNATHNARPGVTSLMVRQVAQSDLARGSRQFNNANLNTQMSAFLPAGAFDAQNMVDVEDAQGVVVGQRHVVMFGTREVEIRRNDTIQSFMDRVNSDPRAGVNLSFDTLRNTFVLEGRGTGEAAIVRTGGEATDRTGFLAHIGLRDLHYNRSFGSGANAGMNQNAPGGTGIDARFVRLAQHFVGVADGDHRVIQASNTLDIFGTTVTVTDAIERDHTFRIETGRDVERTIEAIRNFVENFNELIRNLHAAHNTPRPRQTNNNFFEPLTDEERAGMSDREIELWEAQARAGILHRDDALRNLHHTIRDWMSRDVVLRDGSTINLFHIGISTGAGTGTERLIGMLDIDEDVLREALQADPESIQNLFMQVPTRDNGDPWPASTPGDRTNPNRMNRQGLGFRINDLIENAIGLEGSIRTRVGLEGSFDDTSNPMSRQIAQYNDRISAMQRFLLRREAHFFNMFARMEQAMAQANAQMDSLWMFGNM